MKRCSAIVLILAVVSLSSSSSSAQSKAAAGFEKLKSLLGEWHGRADDGRQVNISYQIVSNGSVLMETLESEREPSMVTMYHLNGDKLMVTHYCSSGTQPRMVADVPTGEVKSLNFTLLDVTNVGKASPGYMRNLAVTFQDKDHIKQVWTYRQDDKDERATFSLERKK